MLKFGNKEFRNLQEQVEENMNNIADILTGEAVLSEFGIRVVGEVSSIEDLPEVDDYKEAHHRDWLYGDAYAVGTEAPYTLYILTRANDEHTEDYWFNIGSFPAPGPQGEQGEQGETGPRGLETLVATRPYEASNDPLPSLSCFGDAEFFNRTPELDETFAVVWKNTETNEVFYCNGKVTNVELNGFRIPYGAYVKVSGQDVLVYKGSAEVAQANPPQTGQLVTGLPYASFSRIPVVNDTMNLIVVYTPTGDVYMTNGKIYSSSSTYETASYQMYSANLISQAAESSDVKASDIDSEETTAGYVLTADGSGGAEWAQITSTPAWGNITGNISSQTDLKNALDAKQDELTFDAYPMAGSNNPVISRGIKSALEAYEPKLTFDSTPTYASTNPVTSHGIEQALVAKQDALEEPSMTEYTLNKVIGFSEQGLLGIGDMPTSETATWGNISGNIANQLDLQSALEDKQDEINSENKLSVDLISGLANVATSGDYSDLLNKPALFSGNYNDLTNKPDLFSGDYNDLTNKPELFSGNYSDLTNKPDLSIYAETADLANVATSGNYSDLSGTPDLSVYAVASNLATVATTGSYDDLTDKPTIPDAQVNSDWDAVSGVAQILNKPSLATVATTGDYDDLLNKPTIPTVDYPVTDVTVDGVSVMNGSIAEITNPGAPTNMMTTNTSQTITGQKTIDADIIYTSPATSARNVKNSGSGYGLNFVDKNNSTVMSLYVDKSIMGIPGLGFTPRVNNCDLGGTGATQGKWRNLYLSGNISNGSSSISVGNLITYANEGHTAVQPGDLANVATSGNYSDLNGTPTLATVATTGNYSDLIDKPASEPLFKHVITLRNNETDSNASTIATTEVITNSSTAFTVESLSQWLYDNEYRVVANGIYPASGACNYNGTNIPVVGIRSTAAEFIDILAQKGTNTFELPHVAKIVDVVSPMATAVGVSLDWADIANKPTETWTFTLGNGSTITKNIVVG